MDFAASSAAAVAAVAATSIERKHGRSSSNKSRRIGYGSYHHCDCIKSKKTHFLFSFLPNAGGIVAAAALL